MFFVLLINPLISQFMDGVYHQSIFNLGFFATLTASGWVFFSLLFGKIGYKGSKMTATTASMVLCSLALIILTLSNNFPLLCTASFLYGASNSIVFFISGIMASSAPQQSIGKWTAITQASITLAGIGAPILGGILYQASPLLAFIPSIIALFILAIIGAVIGFKRDQA